MKTPSGSASFQPTTTALVAASVSEWTRLPPPRQPRSLLLWPLVTTIALACVATVHSETQSSVTNIAPGLNHATITCDAPIRDVVVHLAIFDPTRYTLRLIDNGGDRATPAYKSLEHAMQSHNCVAGCNGGYFSLKTFQPVDLVISDGKRTGTFNPNTWMPALLAVRKSGISLIARDKFDPSDRTITELVQGGPWLVRQGRSASPFQPGAEPARRTFVAIAEDGSLAIGYCSAITLHDLSLILVSKDMRGVLQVTTALNLDGGPSSGLWIKTQPRPFYAKEASTVRNFVGIHPRP